jgi:crotonobetainyl-CoA:carnitine CoA-transferase CaiB-like acyl-CoA transferase
MSGSAFTPTSSHPPLAGVRVIELGSVYAAPTAGRMLRDFSADVIKVENPHEGDFARQWQPIHNGLAIGFARLNSGKRSVGIDLRHRDGRDVVRSLIAGADVVIENFRPRKMESWDLGWRELSEINPGLVMTRVSGFGQTGPYRERPGFGTVAETASGYAFLNGWPETPPTAPPFGFADSIADVTAAFGTTMSLFRREVTVCGSEVDVALYEPLMFMLGDAVVNYTASGRIMQRHGNASGAASPRGIYQASDDHWLAIAASNLSIAMKLFDAMNRRNLATDKHYATNTTRMANNASLQEIVTAWVRARPRAEVLRMLEQHEVVAAPVNDAREVVEDPHFKERTLVDLAHTLLGPALVPGPVLHVSRFAGPLYDGVPDVGEHTSEVLADELGLDPATLFRLADEGVLSRRAD